MSFSLAYVARYEAANRLDDLNEAIRRGREALDATPDDEPSR